MAHPELDDITVKPHDTLIPPSVCMDGERGMNHADSRASIVVSYTRIAVAPPATGGSIVSCTIVRNTVGRFIFSLSISRLYAYSKCPNMSIGPHHGAKKSSVKLTMKVAEQKVASAYE